MRHRCWNGFLAASRLKAVVSLANNHVTDYGLEGLDALLRYLDARGFGYFDAGPDGASASLPFVWDYNGLKLAFIGFAWPVIEAIPAGEGQGGCSPLPSSSTMMNIVAELRLTYDHVIVSMHWGYEFERYPYQHIVDWPMLRLTPAPL